MDELTVAQYAAQHGLTRARVSRLCKDGRLPCTVNGRGYKIKADTPWPASETGRPKGSRNTHPRRIVPTQTCARCGESVTIANIALHLELHHAEQIRQEEERYQRLVDLVDLMHVQIHHPLVAAPPQRPLPEPTRETEEAMLDRARVRQGNRCIYPCLNFPRVLRRIDPSGSWDDDNLQAMCGGCARKAGRAFMREWENAHLDLPDESDVAEL